MAETDPLFIVIEPGGAEARAPARRIVWACAAGAGVAERRAFAKACGTLAALAEDHAVFLADPLFDAPRLEAAFAAAGLAPLAGARDWLLALASFGQARNFAAILEAADLRADPANPATRLLAAWAEAKARSDA